MPAKQYEVLNPREIPKETHILRFGEQMWYEGEAFVKPSKMPLEAVKKWVKDGFLKDPDAEDEVTDG